MPTAKSDVIRMRHMLDAAMKAIRFCSGKTRVDLTTDEQLTLALVRLIEILGEAAVKVTVEVQQRYSIIPWRQIVGTRNRLIHGYEDVNLDILWQIIRHDLPTLVKSLQDAIDSEEQTEQQKLF
jgi:uncharacterized protein with HEPN domain